MKTLFYAAVLSVVVSVLSASAFAQCSPQVQPVGAGGAGVLILQSKPAGLLGRRTQTRSTMILPIGASQNHCPPCPDNDDTELQVELLRAIITEIKEKRQEAEVEQQNRETRQMLMLMIELMKQNQQQAQIQPIPSTLFKTGQWRSVR